ncbi:MAG TPA: hypothetical protein VFJ85_16630 [Acidimicrobiales bacterium]|nr:hypothetical protein [Acidimicrobiales bacterium]
MQRRVRRHLPEDYRRFIDEFGQCALDDGHLWILSPFDFGGTFWQMLDDQPVIDSYDLPASVPGEPRRMEPRPKGMIPWGTTDDGGTYLWEPTDPDPECWTVYVEWDLYGASYPLGMSEFLLAGIRGELDAHAFGEGFSLTPPIYLDRFTERVDAGVDFDPPVRWDPAALETLCRIFGLPQPRGNTKIVRPQGWNLCWTAGRLTFSLPPSDIDAPKSQVADLAAALGVRIVRASPSTWSDLVVADPES